MEMKKNKVEEEVNYFFDYLIGIFLSYYQVMVIKTELCNFCEWKIYPGKGIRYVAKDGRPFLFLSKRNRNFGLRYTSLHTENSKPKDSDGLPPGDVSIKN